MIFIIESLYQAMGCSCSKEDFIINEAHYSLINKIADGGFGVINLVENKRDHKQYAMKQVKSETRKEMEKMSHENKYYKQLNSHSNLIKLIDDYIREDRGSSTFTIFSIFPYYSKGTLQDELENNVKLNKSIDTSRILRLMNGLFDGTNFIHESNLAHRDLKPQNCLLSNDREMLILTDYGSMTERTISVNNIRKAQEIQEWAAENCSMFYRAPELFEPRINQSINEKADIWSLGCILYATMFNKGPFDYVCERGDSIALAVANANFKIDQRLMRPTELTDLLHKMIVTDEIYRENLLNIIESINQQIEIHKSTDPKDVNIV